MFGQFSRAMARVARRAAAANLRAAAEALEELGPPTKKPARRKRPAAAKPKPPRPGAAKPRETLGDALRRIKAGGMPPQPPAAAVRPATPRGASFRLAAFASDQGRRSYRLYVPAAAGPAGARAPMPLVVMLHGCGQTAVDFAAGTGMNALAEEFGLLVAYPSQPADANGNRCWNWFRRTDQGRGAGEPSLIAGIVAAIGRDHPVDSSRVYVAGLSAGGSAAAILAAAYPDVFAAAGVHSGLPPGAACDPASAFVAMQYGAPGDARAVATPTIVFHGDADPVVHPRNGSFMAARTVSAHPRPASVTRRGRSPGGRDYSMTAYRAGTGKVCCEHWVVEGAGHAWSGGHPSGSYTDPAGPDASRAMLRFFLRHRRRERRITGP